MSFAKVDDMRGYSNFTVSNRYIKLIQKTTKQGFIPGEGKVGDRLALSGGRKAVEAQGWV